MLDADKAINSYSEFIKQFPGLINSPEIPNSIYPDDVPVLSGTGVHLMISSFPKSASRFFIDLFVGSNKLTEVNLNLALRAVESESLDVGYLAANHQFNYVTHLHTRCYNTLPLKLLAFSIRTIILTRNIYDVIVSAKEHLDKSEHMAHIIRTPKEYKSFDDIKKYDFLIDYFVPWLFGFYASWKNAVENNWVLASWVNYSDLITATDKVIQKVSDELKIELFDGDIENMCKYAKYKKSNFNVGLPGRGKKKLNDSQIEKILYLKSFYTEYKMDELFD